MNERPVHARPTMLLAVLVFVTAILASVRVATSSPGPAAGPKSPSSATPTVGPTSQKEKLSAVIVIPPGVLMTVSGNLVTVAAYMYFPRFDSKAPLVGKRVRFESHYPVGSNGGTQRIGEATTDASGKASITYKCEAHNGDNEIAAYFNQNNEYPEFQRAESHDGRLSVQRASIGVSFDPPIPTGYSAHLGQKLAVKALVKRLSDGKPLAAVPIKLYIDNVLLVSGQTDHSGRANLLLPAVRTELGTGNHTMSLQVDAGDTYADARSANPVLLLPAVDQGP